MSVLNPFLADGFSLSSMTAGIINQPFTPTTLGQLGIFEEAGVVSLTAAF